MKGLIVFDRRVLLQNEQIQILANELVKKLDNVPGWNYDKRKQLTSECIKKAEWIIATNVRAILKDKPGCSIRELFAGIVVDYFETPEQRYR